MDVSKKRERGKRNGRRRGEMCVNAERSGVCFCWSASMCMSPSELLREEWGQEGSGRQNTTYGGLMRFYVEGYLKKG